MTYTGDNSSNGDENELRYNKNGTVASDPNLIWDSAGSSLFISGKLEQKVSNVNLVKMYPLGNSVKGIFFQGGSIVITNGSEIIKTDTRGNIIAQQTVALVDEVINDGVNIYTITTSTDTIRVLDQDLNTLNIITDSINLPGPTRFIRHSKYLFIACSNKLSRFNTATKSIDGTFEIIADTFIDLTIKGNTLIALRQTSISEINTSTMQLIKNVTSSDIVSPRRIRATRDTVFVLTDSSLLTFDTALVYKGLTTAGMSTASTLSIYGSFLIVGNDTGTLSI